LGWQAGKARFDHVQACAVWMRLERELDQRHRRLARVGLPAKREAMCWLDGLDHAAAGAAWASGTVPCKNDFSARAQIDGRLRAEPGTELVRSSQRCPYPRGWHGQDDFAFDRIGNLHGNLRPDLQLYSCACCPSRATLQPNGCNLI